MSNDYMNAIMRFKEERTRRGLTQEQLCRHTGMAQSAFSRAEAGLRRFSFPKTRELCSAVNVFYVFTGSKADVPWGTQRLALSTAEETLCHLYLVQVITNALRNTGRSKSFSGASENPSYGRILGQLDYLRYFPGGPVSGRNIFYDVRHYFGHTQTKMAAILGIDIKKMRDLEKGRCLPDSEVIWKMYDRFHVSPAFILQDVNALRDELDYVLGLLGENDRETILLVLGTWTALL